MVKDDILSLEIRVSALEKAMMKIQHALDILTGRFE